MDTGAVRLRGFLGLCDDEWIIIVRHLLGGKLVVRLNDSHACKTASVLFRINKSVRESAHRIYYKYVKFTAGVELLCRPGSLQSRQHLRLDTVRYITHLTIPARLVHAFSRPDYQITSTARHFDSLKTLIVDFDGGEWDDRMAIPDQDWTPHAYIEGRVRLCAIQPIPSTCETEGKLMVSCDGRSSCTSSRSLTFSNGCAARRSTT